MFKIHRFETIESTNETAKLYAQLKHPEGTVIVALEQTKGKGQFGRTWQSATGNLYFSLILTPKIEKQRNLPQLSLILANVIKNCLIEFQARENVEFKVKPPNDILANNKKICGILIEVENNFAIVGVGINIKNNPKNIDQPTTKLNDLLLNATNPTTVLEKILPAIWNSYNSWQEI